MRYLMYGLLALLVTALVASMWVPHMCSHCGQPERQATIATLKNLIPPLEKYKADTGQYPSTTEGLRAPIAAPPATPHWKGPYLDKIPQDAWHHDFLYRTPSTIDPDHLNYDIVSAGKD